jgi:hypothetical protein
MPDVIMFYKMCLFSFGKWLCLFFLQRNVIIYLKVTPLSSPCCEMPGFYLKLYSGRFLLINVSCDTHPTVSVGLHRNAI